MLPLQLICQTSHAAPTGGEVVAGQAAIAQIGNITDINQASQNAIINWQQFNVKPSETVNFKQPNAQAVTLNRVIGNERSVIDGAINANGKVFIQNEQGTLIGKDAKINVGSLVATTAHISDDDFMNGRYQFEGGSQGAIENLGQITVPKGGMVALVAPIVKNGGTIKAPQGNALLASAESFSITLPDNANFSYTLNQGTLQGLVDNGGAILADGGRVVLTAKGVDTVKKSVIRHTGVIEANTVSNKNGVIELLGDLDNTALNVSGTLKAEGKGADKGGFIETSAAKLDIADSAYVSTQSEQGQTGTWLIDPKDFTVAPQGGDTTGAKVSDGLKTNNVQLKSREGAKEGKGDVIINDTISWSKNKLTLTADNDIHINKTLNGTGTASLALEYGQGSADGRVKVVRDGRTEWEHAEYYLDLPGLRQENNVKVNLPIGRNFSTKRGSNGQAKVFNVVHQMPSIKNNGFTDDFNAEYVVLGKDIDLSYTKNHPTFIGFGKAVEEGGFVDVRSFDGLGHTLSNLNINANKSNTGGVSGNREQSVIVHQLPVRSQIPARQSQSQVFKYNNRVAIRLGLADYVKLHVEGEELYINSGERQWEFGHSSFREGGVPPEVTLDRSAGILYIDPRVLESNTKLIITDYASRQASEENIGLFRFVHNADIRNLKLTNVNINAGSHAVVGAVVGGGEQVKLFNVAVTGNVSGSDKVGGLVGELQESGNDISFGHFSGKVSGTDAVGGLAGAASNALIDFSSASGSVATPRDGRGNMAGGLIGEASGVDIYNSHALNHVSGSSYLGGLVGVILPRNSGDDHPSLTIINSLATGQVDNQPESGGLVGGGIGVSPTSHGTLSVENSYFDKNTTGQSKTFANKGEAKTTEQLKQKSTFKGWDTSIWDIQDGKVPTLRSSSIHAPSAPTVEPEKPKEPVDNKALVAARESVEQTRLFRQNQLNKLKTLAQNGVLADTVDINNQIRSKINEAIAAVKVLPDGADKTELAHQLAAITVLTQEEIAEAIRTADRVKADKLKQEQDAKLSAERLKEARELVDTLKAKREAIKNRLLESARNGTLLNTDALNDEIRQYWLNANAKVQGLKDGSEKSGLQQRLQQYGTLSEADINEAKRLVQQELDRRREAEERRRREEEEKRRLAEAEKAKADEARYLEQFRVARESLESAERQHQTATERWSRIADTEDADELENLNRVIKRAVDQAREEIDALPEGNPKDILVRRLEKLTLLTGKGAVSVDLQKKIEKAEVEKPKSKEAKAAVDKPEVNKKDEPTSKQMKQLFDIDLEEHWWENYFTQDPHRLEDFKRGALFFGGIANAQNLAERIFDYRESSHEIDEQASRYVDDISDKINIQGGSGAITIKDYIKSSIMYKLSIREYDNLSDDYNRLKNSSYLVEDKRLSTHIERNKNMVIQYESIIEEDRRRDKEYSWKKFGRDVKDTLTDSGLLLWDSVVSGYTVGKYIIPSMRAWEQTVDKATLMADIADWGKAYGKIDESLEHVKLGMEVILDIPQDIQFFLDLDDSSVVESSDYLLNKLSKYASVFKFSEAAGNRVGILADLSKIYTEIDAAAQYIKSISAITKLPSDSLSQYEKDAFIRLFNNRAQVSFLNAGVLGLKMIMGSTPITKKVPKFVSDMYSDLNVVLGQFDNVDNRVLAKNLRYGREKMDRDRKNLESISQSRSVVMRDVLIGVGKKIDK